MSDSEKNPEKDKETGGTENQSLNESQDFHLVDAEDENPLDKTEGTPEKVQENTESSVQEGPEEKGIKEDEETNVDTTEKIERSAESNKGKSESDILKNESLDSTTDEKSSNISNTDNTGKLSDEEDQIVQGTPPQNLSPTKKQVFSSVTPSLKRKAEAFDEPVFKLLITSTREDTLNFDKKKIEDDESQEEFPRTGSQANVIIEETQDPVEAESHNITPDKPEKLDIPKDDVDKSTFAQVYREKTEILEKCYNIDKNENLNTPTKLSESIITETADKENASSKNTKETDNNSLSCETKEKSESDEKSRSDLNHDESDERVDDAQLLPNDHETTEKKVAVESIKVAESSTKNNNVPDKVDNKVAPNESHCLTKSRMSIEVVYARTAGLRDAKSKPKEFIEIDEDGEKIILDSSEEDYDPERANKNETLYKSCYDSKNSSDFSYKSVQSTKESSSESKSDSRLTKSNSDSSRKCDTDGTASVESDMFTSDISGVQSKDDSSVQGIDKQAKNVSLSKEGDSADILSVSDNDPELNMIDDTLKNKSYLVHGNSLAKALQVEREINIYVKLKCLLHVDESTKEFLSKEVTNVHCEPMAESSSIRQKSHDNSASLADISGNDKDRSPGSVNSNPQMFQLNPSRLSLMSTISSSSASSAASLAAKLAAKDNMHFSFPRGPAKHAKKHHDSMEKQTIDEYERLTKEWKNSRLITTTILNCANTELMGVDTHNVSNERLDVQLPKIRFSTPEIQSETAIDATTPKSTAKGKAKKRLRSKSSRFSAHTAASNENSPDWIADPEDEATPRKRKKTKPYSTGSNTPLWQNIIQDDLLGKEVFAKWSDKNYYPGIVAEKVKTKYKVNFYDGEKKLLIKDFIIPIPKRLNDGLSVYATTDSDDYGSCGIILYSQMIDDEIYYIIKADDETVRVTVKNIFLSSDQADILRETSMTNKSLPSTPKHLGDVSLDNIVDGQRRSKRIATPSFSTPKAKVEFSSPTNKEVSASEPSVSGIAPKVRKEKVSSENDGLSSDSNVSVKEEPSLEGVQPEVAGTSVEQILKGPQNRIKGKPRSKKKQENEKTIAMLGPIPPANSTLFKGMSFILSCASLELLDRYCSNSKDSESEIGTENEEEWVQTPFITERLKTQIITGGGKVYNDFNSIAQEEYKNTKLITNVPNTTAKSLLCLSVGIPAYNHNWIIRCCQQDKIVSPAENELPAGWSLSKKSYVEMFQRPNSKPLTQVIIIIPHVSGCKQFVTFWRQICENAGAVVLLAENSENIEGFVEGTVILTNHRCPSWALEKADKLQIPLVSSTWVVQCLIEGKMCPLDEHDRYRYNCI